MKENHLDTFNLPSNLNVALKTFCDKALIELETAGVLGDISQIDHACFRVATVSTYEAYKKVLSDCGQLLS